MTATPAEAPPAGNGATAGTEDELREAERDTEALRRAQLEAELPEHARVLEDGSIGYAEGWKECPLCAGRGAVQPKFQQSGAHLTCPDCGGLGDVMTGSLVAGKDSIMCNTCTGNGYLDRTEWARIERERREAESGGS